MRITVSGLPGSGTTSLATHLAEVLQIDLISAGEVFRRMAAERGMGIAEFGRHAEKDPSLDHMIDERQKEIALSHEDIIVEGRLSAWFVPEADLKVWLFAPVECRVMRIQSRDTIAHLDRAAELTQEREASEALRYRTYYGIDIADLSPYHLVLNSSLLSVEELGEIVCCTSRLIAARAS
ncbi:MAG TPA: AAA family ATPase [Methanoregulaceae archaeon]|nr:MAG: AAA family ATPase [Methanolinea sp.]HON81630.1 AAA family ATPase [Methanoregulaceae archaeon]HPD10437.1 AAA family ATPase [Methanoregulaceae archaeon]HRT15379.1 AAA family ATPase [Methanoregulaceae archaeon]HRU31029.1 AAA family ATPase [Methanoregulaceae archaeon]